jgi:hypothetical protein
LFWHVAAGYPYPLAGKYMKNLSLITWILFINIILGNLILYLSGYGHLITSFISGGETGATELTLHGLCSLFSLFGILLITKIINRSCNIVKVVIMSLFSAPLIPFLSVLTIFIVDSFLRKQYEAIIAAFIFAGAATAKSILFWIPFSIINMYLFSFYYSKTSESSPANKKIKPDD